MTLQEILFGTFVPPESQGRITHRIGLSGGKSYEPTPDKRMFRQDGMNKAQFTMYERLKHQVREVTAVDMGKKLKITTNHAGILLGELFKLGKVTRKRVCGNGTRYFLYRIKETSCQ